MGKKKKALKKAAQTLRSDGGTLSKINDRISYILIKTGKDRDDLEKFLSLDPNYLPYEQPGRTYTSIIKDCADYLGVSVHWLISGEGEPFPVKDQPQAVASIDNAGNIDGSALLQGNTAGSIVINTGGEKLSNLERELLRLFRGFSIKQQISLLNFGYQIENKNSP